MLVADPFSNLELKLGLRDCGHYLTGVCPFHNGDNCNSLTIYKDTGIWFCHTKQCHEKIGHGINDFAKAIGREINFQPNENQKFLNREKFVAPTELQSIDPIKLEVPSKYFIERGYSEWVLKEFGVGDIKNSAAVPIFCRCKLVGYSYRTHNEKCYACSKFHTAGERCSIAKTTPKWVHSKNLKTAQILYGFDRALPYIIGSRTVILCESAGNVWRLVESGINNVVGIFGTSLSSEQTFTLMESGCDTVILALDNDGAGTAATDRINNKLRRRFNIKKISPCPNIDWGELSVIRIQEIFKREELI